MAKKPKTQAEILKALGRMASLDSAVGGSKVPTVSGDFNAGGLPGAAEEPKKSGGFLSGLKNIGKTALNLLSVPQATAFTFLQKGAHYGSGGAVKDTSWKNLVGTFRGSKYHGGAGLLEGFGVGKGAARKWGGLGLDLIADPLNLIGGTVLLKGIKAGKALAEGGKVTDIFKAAPQVAHEAAGKPVADSALAGKLFSTTSGGIKTQTPAERLTDIEKEIARLTKGKKKTSHLKDEAGTLIQHGELGKQIDIARKSHKKVKDLVAEANKIQEDLAGRQIQSALAKGQQPLESTFARNVDKAKRPKKALRTAYGKTLKDIPIGLGQMDEAGQLIRPAEQLGAATAGHIQNVIRPAGEYGIKFGIGDKSLKFGLGITAKEKTLAGKSLRRGHGILHPAQAVAHAIRRSSSELASHADESLGKYAAQFTTQEKAAIHLAAVAQFEHGQAKGAEFIRGLQADNLWSPKMDEGLQYILNQGHTIGKAEGLTKVYAKELLQEQRKLREMQKTLPLGSLELNQQITKIRHLEDRGKYVPTGQSEGVLTQLLKDKQAAYRTGEQPRPLEFTPGKNTVFDPKQQKVIENPLGATSQADFQAQMGKAGFDEATAQTLADKVQNILGDFAPVTKELKPGLQHEAQWDSFLLMGDRMKAHYDELARHEINKLVDEAGIRGSDVGQAIEKSFNTRRAPGSIGSTTTGQKLQHSISWMKAVFTTINPSHYVNNFVGDYINHLVNGNVRHLKSTAFIPRSQYWKLAKGDAVALQKDYNVAGKVYTGEQLRVLSHLTGLGRGYVGADIHDMVDLLHHGKNPFAIMSRFNMSRENAVRMETWVKHMQAGDDPFVAGAKTLRVHFDYNELTDFEKVWTRNLLLFYTWLKRNSMLHANGMITRPGIYQAYGDLEQNRQKFKNEPSYYGQQGAITIPGVGNVAFANPINDIFKWDVSQSGLRRTALGSITPPVRIPLELLSNTNYFTGGKIEDFTDQNKPYFLSKLLGSGATVDGKPAMDAQVAFALSQILGPQAGTAQANYLGDQTGTASLQRVFGVRTQPHDQAKFDKNAKAAETKRKADATRKKNKEGG